MMNNFHTKTLLATTQNFITKLQQKKPAFLSTFYLSGGTALSLQLGHRISEDLDFFTSGTFKGFEYQHQLEEIGLLDHTELDDTGLNTNIDGVKIQLLHYPYPLLENPFDWDGLRISGKLDIACTKLITISSRGGKKDFIDLFFLLKEYTLQDLFGSLANKYTGIHYNKIHILKSLTYFVDADAQPMPRMLMNLSWDEVKDKIIESVKSLKF
jgi:hypothetical protein